MATADLEEAGWSGQIGAVRPEYFPVPQPEPEPGLALGMSITLPGKIPRAQWGDWPIGPELTGELVRRGVRWTSQVGGDCYFAHGMTGLRVDPSMAADLAVRALAVRPQLSIGFHRARTDFRRVLFGFYGRLVYEISSGMAWQQDLAELRQVLLDHADSIVHGLVRTSWSPNGGWETLVLYRPPLPPAPVVLFAPNPRQFDAQVPDAYGLQVLTDTQLARAHDLSGWDLTDLGHGRHLLASRDPAAWFTQPGPSDDVVAQARADFGDMIISPDTPYSLD